MHEKDTTGYLTQWIAEEVAGRRLSMEIRPEVPGIRLDIQYVRRFGRYRSRPPEPRITWLRLAPEAGDRFVFGRDDTRPDTALLGCQDYDLTAIMRLLWSWALLRYERQQGIVWLNLVAHPLRWTDLPEETDDDAACVLSLPLSASIVRKTGAWEASSLELRRLHADKAGRIVSLSRPLRCVELRRQVAADTGRVRHSA